MNKFVVLKGKTGLTRLETFNSRSHLVVPIVALIESVMKGALAPVDVFGKFPDGWNGRPVVINHPEKRGVPVSANSVDVLEEELVGQIFNTSVDGKKLKMEAWIDLSRAEELGGVAEETINILKEGEEPIEVSTGLFVETEQKEGKLDGEPYTEVWTHTVPDHLAVLEHGATGECSLTDGCGGPRINTSDEEIPSDPAKFFAYMKKKVELFFNKKHGDMNDTDIRRALQAAIETEDTWSFVVAVEGNSFISESFDGLFRRDFSISDDGTVTIGSESTRVRMETDFIEVKIETNEKENAMKIEEKVDALIANEASNFEEGDKEYLLTLDEEKLNGFEPKKVEAAPKEEPKEIPVPVVVENAEEETSPEEFLKGAPDNIREVLSFGLKAHEERKASLIEKIIKHNGNKFTEDELSKMDVQMLTNVSSLIPEEVADYSNRGAPRSHVDGEDKAIPAPPSVVDLLEAKSAAK